MLNHKDEVSTKPIDVPGKWNKQLKDDGEGDPLGYGSYYLKFLSIQMMKQHIVYELQVCVVHENCMWMTVISEVMGL